MLFQDVVVLPCHCAADGGSPTKAARRLTEDVENSGKARTSARGDPHWCTRTKWCTRTTDVLPG